MSVVEQLNAVRDELAAVLNDADRGWNPRPVDGWQPESAAFDIEDIHFEKGLRVTVTCYGPADTDTWGDAT